jgi:hypothetical protein
VPVLKGNFARRFPPVGSWPSRFREGLSKWRSLPGLAAVLAAALAVRTLYLLSYRSSPFPGLYFVDQLYYRSWALALMPDFPEAERDRRFILSRRSNP